MSVESKYNAAAIDNINRIISAAKAAGINNDFTIAGILAVVSKETGFKLVPEVSYANNTAPYIRSIFPTALAGLTDAQINTLKKNKVNFFNYVYKNFPGNTLPGDGYTYRGRGFNGITGREGYRNATKDTGQDLIKNPDLLNNFDTAAKALIGYYLRWYPLAVKSGKYNIGPSINSLPDLDTAYKVAFNINRGRHKLPIQDPTNGFPRGLENLPDLFDYVKKKRSYIIPRPGFWERINLPDIY